MSDIFGRGLEDLFDMQQRFNEINNMMLAYMEATFSSQCECQCGQDLLYHCKNCGACDGELCNPAHLTMTKFGYAQPDVLDTDVVLDDILDAEVIG